MPRVDRAGTLVFVPVNNLSPRSEGEAEDYEKKKKGQMTYSIRARVSYLNIDWT